MIKYAGSVVARMGDAGPSTLIAGGGEVAPGPGAGVERPKAGVVALENNLNGEGESERRMLTDRGVPKAC